MRLDLKCFSLTFKRHVHCKNIKGTELRPLTISRCCSSCLEFLQGAWLLNNGLKHSRSKLVSKLVKIYLRNPLLAADFQPSNSESQISKLSLQKTVRKVSLILVTPSSRSDSNFEGSHINLKENKRDGVDSNSSGFDYCVRKNEGKILWFSAD